MRGHPVQAGGPTRGRLRPRLHDQDVAVGRVAAGADSSQQIASQLQL